MSRVTQIVFVGDSLTEGYGVRKEEAYPSLVEKLLNGNTRDNARRVKTINGSISGSVTAEADRRVKWSLKSKPDILVLALGANDSMKGTPPKVIKANLAKAIDEAKAGDVKVVLAGMKVFSSMGTEYGREFEKIYSDLAREKKITLIPFLLEGVAMEWTLNQADRKHPNAKGHEKIARTVARALEPLL
jgi:acyl-CoA thioesterase-1